MAASARPARQTSAPIPDTTLDFGDPLILDSVLSEMARGLRGSAILRIASEVRALVATGRPLCNLTVGDFDPRQFPIPPLLREGIIRAIGEGETNYPPSDGLLTLREAVAESVRREHDVEYPIESVLITAGGRPAIYAAFRCLLDAGDAVLYPVPSWNNDYYIDMVKARGIPVRTTAAQRFQPTLDQLEPHLAEAGLLCLCSPNNPTGTTLAPDVLDDILRAVVRENERRQRARRRPLFVLYDLIYGSLVQPGVPSAHPLALVPEAAPWVIVIDGISKGFAATGLRVGWAIGAPAVIARMRDFLGHVGAWAPRPEQKATAAFLREPAAIAEFREAITRGLRVRLDAVSDGVLQLKREGLPLDCVRPEGAMYGSLGVELVGRTVNGTVVEDNEALRRLLLTGAGLAAVPFQAFGVAEDTGWFRLSVGAVSVADIEALWPRVRKLLGGSK
ncbi:MAG: pyridoxal phosphate-dependent aminotransferase [Gemmatimonadales bacterium]